MLTALIVYLACALIFCAGFVLGAVFAARRRSDALPCGETTNDVTPYSAIAQLSAMDVTRRADHERREQSRRADEESVVWLKNPKLNYWQVRAIAERRRAERHA